MRKLLLACIVTVSSQCLFAQSAKNYILEIDGDTIHVALDQPANFKSKNGQAHKVKLARKEFINFTNEFISFDYPSQYSISTTKIDDDTDQFLIMTATGTGVMIQVYKAMNPESVVDVMLEEVTKDDITAGYKQTLSARQKTLRDGNVLKGKSSVLKLDDDMSEFVCLAKGKRRQGVMIMELKNDIIDAEAKKLLDIFWKTLTLRY